MKDVDSQEYPLGKSKDEVGRKNYWSLRLELRVHIELLNLFKHKNATVGQGLNALTRWPHIQSLCFIRIGVPLSPEMESSLFYQSKASLQQNTVTTFQCELHKISFKWSISCLFFDYFCFF